MIVKVCGMRDPENIRALEQLDVDWMGFVFWSESPRYVSMLHSRAGIIPDYNPLPGEHFKSEDDRPAKRPKRVGVFAIWRATSFGDRLWIRSRIWGSTAVSVSSRAARIRLK